MNDPFSYSARWGSVGLDCAFCKHQSNVQWPNLKRNYACDLHGVSLAKELGSNGYKEGEWFCSAFSNNGAANPKAKREFESILSELTPKVLYGAYGSGNQLKEIPFVEL